VCEAVTSGKRSAGRINVPVQLLMVDLQQLTGTLLFLDSINQ